MIEKNSVHGDRQIRLRKIQQANFKIWAKKSNPRFETCMSVQ